MPRLLGRMVKIQVEKRIYLLFLTFPKLKNISLGVFKINYHDKQT